MFYPNYIVHLCILLFQAPSVVGCEQISYYLIQRLPYDTTTSKTTSTRDDFFADGNLYMSFKVWAVNDANISSTEAAVKNWTSRIIRMYNHSVINERSIVFVILLFVFWC